MYEFVRASAPYAFHTRGRDAACLSGDGQVAERPAPYGAECTHQCGRDAPVGAERSAPGDAHILVPPPRAHILAWPWDSITLLACRTYAYRYRYLDGAPRPRPSSFCCAGPPVTVLIALKAEPVQVARCRPTTAHPRRICAEGWWWSAALRVPCGTPRPPPGDGWACTAGRCTRHLCLRVLSARSL